MQNNQKQNSKTRQLVIDRIRCWLESVVIALDLCPFAGSVLHRNQVRYQLVDADDRQSVLESLLYELIYLDSEKETETTLLILPQGFESFDDYLDLVELAEQLLVSAGYEGIYQIATFHPDYCFAGSKPNDPANYTNRSPYPILHLLREASLEKAIAHYPDAQHIPDRNIEKTRQLGEVAMKERLAHCLKTLKEQ